AVSRADRSLTSIAAGPGLGIQPLLALATDWLTGIRRRTGADRLARTRAGIRGPVGGHGALGGLDGPGELAARSTPADPVDPTDPADPGPSVPGLPGSDRAGPAAPNPVPDGTD